MYYSAMIRSKKNEIHDGKNKQTTLIKQREHNCIYTINNRSNNCKPHYSKFIESNIRAGDIAQGLSYSLWKEELATAL